MQQLPKTFCPAKWDEITFNLSYNYVYTCCKAIPIKHDKNNYISIINEQKNNLLNGIQDPSCEYCWKVENKNLPSRRHEYLKTFDIKNFDSYKTNTIQPKLVELYIGNECNFQCTYCNPKFSSQWESDIIKKSYKIFSDKFFFSVDEKNKNTSIQALDTVLKINRSAKLIIQGGEPLHNKLFWEILEKATVKNFAFSTNLSCKTNKEIDRLFDKARKFENISINVSIDSTDENAEFTRYGIDFKQFEKNFDYLINTAPSNVHININSVMTSITIRDLNKFLNFIQRKKTQYQKLLWVLNPCIYPRIQSFDTLKDKHKLEIIEIIKEIKKLDFVYGIDAVESALTTSKFNNTLYQELKHFMTEFAERKGISIPVCLN